MKDKNKCYLLSFRAPHSIQSAPFSTEFVFDCHQFHILMAHVCICNCVYVCVCLYFHISVFVFVKMSGEICVKGGATMQLSRWQEAPEW